jgi:deoxyxylulose-5-phosphate synthase
LWNNFFTDCKNTISNRTFALCQINYLQALITLPICACSIAQLLQLAQELRNFIIDVVSVKEGHLGVGVIELTIALHYV